MFDSEQAKVVEAYVRENIYTDKRTADFALMGTTNYDSGDQILYSFKIAPWDIMRNAHTLFTVNVLIDRQNRILSTGIYDEYGKKIDALTSRIIDLYLERKASRDLRLLPANPIVIIRGY